MYALGRECGRRWTMSSPPKKAMAWSVEATWQVPPPVPSTISPLRISNACLKPLSSVRGPTTSLKLTDCPASMTVPSTCDAATSMLRARGPWSPWREKYVSNDAMTCEMSTRASDSRVTRGSTGTKGSSISTALASRAAWAMRAAAPSGSTRAAVLLGHDVVVLEVEACRHRGDVEILLERQDAIDDRAGVDARLERNVELAPPGAVREACPREKVIRAAETEGARRHGVDIHGHAELAQ